MMMLYLSLAPFDSVRQSPFADSIDALHSFILLRQVQAAAHAPRGYRGSQCLINKATRHQVRGDKGILKLPDGRYMS